MQAKLWRKKIKIWRKIFFFTLGITFGGFFTLTTFIIVWERQFDGRVYSGVRISGKDFGGKTPKEVEDFFKQKNSELSFQFTFSHQSTISTLSAQDLDWGYNEKLIAAQAFYFGRSGHLFSDLYFKTLALRNGFDINPAYYYNDVRLTSLLSKLGEKIDIPAQEGLFQYSSGKVTAFRPSRAGQILDIEEAKKNFADSFKIINTGTSSSLFVLKLPVKKIEPKVTTENANNLGIKELVASGSSRFVGSIPNRIHNIQLAASRLNGILVAPGEEFSFNNTLGDVSKFTGYKEAYVIQNGRTVLGDGGGVCQVSTTLFRALLNAGLPITERHPHSYRVGYYEQGSPVGLDASVYAPNWDLKFRNDTGSYLLIQSVFNLRDASLVFELYGQNDGRTAIITTPQITNQKPPPEDLYQDGPTLPKGELKQVDWKAWGADVSFSRVVKKGEETLISEKFNSRYQPWQSVFLRGTKE
ncbi:VanW family protein [Candidatus Microgenomates bacterium]|nr:VanW family protein [Candidatus Microgenomates bacterium]